MSPHFRYFTLSFTFFAFIYLVRECSCTNESSLHRIWEKKFGRNANHVKKQQEEERAASEAKALAAKARAAQRLAAATQGDAPGPGGRGRGRAFVPPPSMIPSRLDGGWKGGAENRKAAPVGGRGVGVPSSRKPAAAPKEEKLHPSWEAKKRLKEKEQIGILPAQGKKIKF